ncbi:hypothetical protein DIPPA_24820 [Diplonema papillatum]|nr:hypothetical protein DIPPA_24820 [Diplonema papillatum]
MHPVLAIPFADLQRLTAYLCTHLNDFPLLDLPCWLLPSSLVYLLGDAKR